VRARRPGAEARRQLKEIFGCRRQAGSRREPDRKEGKSKKAKGKREDALRTQNYCLSVCSPDSSFAFCLFTFAFYLILAR
jgi:hypothetical protein